MERNLRLGNVTRQVAIALGEMYPAIGIFPRIRWDKELQDKANLGNSRNAMFLKKKDRRCGADPPKNFS